MDTTFITIHDLSDEARILYSSDSIVDILGHTPDEVVGKSCWDFFHPNELPWARKLHGRSVELDKAAVLAYCQIRNRQGQWVCCECCFSVCYDVLVVCTSIYHRGLSSQKRATEAPIVRRLFSSSPKDPRYHMLSHLSAKFKQDKREQTQEPRAALFLNRFTRTLTIMYATSGIENVIGIPGENMKGRSFYYCIAENCLEDAVKCLETAKSNDSIAYLRFWFRDPRQDDAPPQETSSEEDTEASMTDVTMSEDDEEDGGVHLDAAQASVSVSGSRSAFGSTLGSRAARTLGPSQSVSSPSSGSHAMDVETHAASGESSRTSSGESLNPENTHSAIFGESGPSNSSVSSASTAPRPSHSLDNGAIELEAVVSCTSDGLVVCLRRARPILPPSMQGMPTQPHAYTNGLFAAPWAPEPVYFPAQPQPLPMSGYYPGMELTPHAPVPNSYYGGPAQRDFMSSIREVAVFAWALTGINGSLEGYSHGRARGEAQPPGGFPVWDPAYQLEGNGTAGPGFNAFSNHYQTPVPLDGLYPKYPFGDPGL